MDDIQTTFLKEQLSGPGLSNLEKMQLKELRQYLKLWTVQWVRYGYRHIHTKTKWRFNEYAAGAKETRKGGSLHKMQWSCEIKPLSQMLYVPQVYIGCKKQTRSWKWNPPRATKQDLCYGLLIPWAHSILEYFGKASVCTCPTPALFLGHYCQRKWWAIGMFGLIKASILISKAENYSLEN